MRAKDEYRDRDDTQVAVLDALADRQETGMTVFDLRAMVDEDIDSLEEALGELKDDGLIDVSDEEGRTMILPKQHVIENGTTPEEEVDFFEKLRRRFPF